MEASIAGRELITLNRLGAAVECTYHIPVPSHLKSYGPQKGPIGIVFINSLSPSRAATGDSAVAWAEAFAQSGYPSFRIDLPGFGDAAGDPPPDLLKYINEGGYASISALKLKEIKERFELSGLVIVGLCSGAVSAIYTAAASKDCRGLVLMDPYFHLPLKKNSELWEKLTGRISRSGLGRFCRNSYDHLKAFLMRNRPPANANFSLLNRWKELTSTDLPILIIKAPSFKPRGEEFDYFAHILALASSRARVTIRMIEGAGHTFSNRVGRAGVRQHTEEWLGNSFPSIESERSPLPVTQLRFETVAEYSREERPIHA